MGQLRRDRGRLTIRAIAERADVSSTFLYENPDARALVQDAVTDSRRRPGRTRAHRSNLARAGPERRRRKMSCSTGNGSASSWDRSATSTRWSPASPSST
ncbi:hypothetical protein ACFQ7Z_23940 [Streptomyces virginiae]|uniref:hypothetical protein n=1 Tax=Streptomyces virginiae TaxID=1961 RepID=UPI00367EC848